MVCTATSQCSNAGVCQAPAGTCTTGTLKVNGTACNDNNNATTGDYCHTNGTCAGVNKCLTTVCPAMQCFAAPTCFQGVCSSGAQLPDGSTCTDNNPLTVGDSCIAGICIPGPNVCANVVCTALDSCSLVGTCGVGGVCSNPTKPDGATCNDGVWFDVWCGCDRSQATR